MKRNYAMLIYFIIFLAIGGIIIFRNEMKLKSKETVVTYSFPPDENITNVVSVTSKTTLNTSDSSSKKSKITTVTTIVVTENTPLYIDLNVASHVDLCKLNGIGDSLADAIISYREQNGGFNNIEEIMNVYGIGENLFENIKAYIYVENPVYPSYEEDDGEYSDESEYEEDESVGVQIYDDETETEPALTLEDVAPIDLNTADAELLILLPHIDEEIAEKIIELREKIHVFSHPYELLYIEDLSQQQVAEIIEYVFVDSEDENDN